MKVMLLAPLALLAGCATVTRGSTQDFVVETTPPGAFVRTSLGQACDATPCTFAKVERDSTFTVTISKPGFQTATRTIMHQTAEGGVAGMAGNLLLGGIVGGAIDATTGATQNLVPNPLRVTLEPVGVAAPVAPSVAPAAPAVAAPIAPVVEPAGVATPIAPVGAPVVAPAVAPVPPAAVTPPAEPPPAAPPATP